jgi:hypothetical protein
VQIIMLSPVTLHNPEVAHRCFTHGCESLNAQRGLTPPRVQRNDLVGGQTVYTSHWGIVIHTYTHTCSNPWLKPTPRTHDGPHKNGPVVRSIAAAIAARGGARLLLRCCTAVETSVALSGVLVVVHLLSIA